MGEAPAPLLPTMFWSPWCRAFPARAVAWALAAVFLSSAGAAQDDETFEDLTLIPLEELMTMQIEVTSVSRSARRVQDSPAAVYVLTQEDLRNSGVTTIMEALRMVPGLQVARISSNTWAISARGFNDQFADKLLVLMDGRTLYTPLFSGTFWDVQHYPLEDIERIEVIRGPGATLWGANAVNGVINVITKSTADTLGTEVVAGAGNQERLFGHVRHGARVGDSFAYRVFASYFDRDGFDRVDGLDPEDEWDQARVGFRADWEASEATTLTVSGEAYSGDSGNLFDLASFDSPPLSPAGAGADVEGGHLLGRWSRRLSDASDVSLQAYVDHTSRDVDSLLRERRTTLDLDFQHQFPLNESNDFLWGLGYRLISSELDADTVVSFDPDERSDQLFSAFVQNETALDERLALTVGTKLEHNDFTGFEVQPNARLAWEISRTETAWAAVSRAVNTPSQGLSDSTLLRGVVPGPGGTPLLFTSFGNDDLEAEELVAYELGFRKVFAEELFLDLALFYNRYDDLFSAEAGAPLPSPEGVVLPAFLTNDASATTHGFELAAEWEASGDWRLQATYSFIEIDTEADSSSQAVVAGESGNTPEQQVGLRSYYELSEALRLNAVVYYVDRIGGTAVDDYVRLDANVEWLPDPDLSLALVAQDLFHGGETEFPATTFLSRAEVEPSVFFRLRWRP